MMRKLFLADERGAAIIELALVAPLLTVMAAGVIDLSTAYSRKLALEQGAQRAIEKIMQTTDDDTVEATLKAEAVCQVNGTAANGTCLSSPITTANVTVTYKLICRNSSGDGVTTQTNTDPDVFDTYVCSGSAPIENRYIEVSIQDNFQGIFIHRFAPGGGSSFPINAAAGMRTQ